MPAYNRRCDPALAYPRRDYRIGIRIGIRLRSRLRIRLRVTCHTLTCQACDANRALQGCLMLRRYRQWREQRLIKKYAVSDIAWSNALMFYPFFDDLTPDQNQRLRNLVSLFCAEKEFVAGGDFEITLAIQLEIAAQACLPILNLDLSFYAGWHGIVVYRGEMRVHREEMDEDGVVHTYDDIISGEAMPGGPVVLSWQDVTLAGSSSAPGYNVVIHEFAHKIDMLKGDATGVPPFSSTFHRDLNGRQFEAVLMQSYQAFALAVDQWEARGEHDDDAPLIDPYAAEHPAEFFAVLSEAFFTKPQRVVDTFPEMYRQLAAYYRQNPCAGASP